MNGDIVADVVYGRLSIVSLLICSLVGFLIGFFGVGLLVFCSYRNIVAVVVGRTTRRFFHIDKYENDEPYEAHDKKQRCGALDNVYDGLGGEYGESDANIDEQYDTNENQ